MADTDAETGGESEVMPGKGRRVQKGQMEQIHSVSGSNYLYILVVRLRFETPRAEICYGRLLLVGVIGGGRPQARIGGG